MEHTERILGGLFGLLVGDAVGVPYEFSKPGSLTPEKVEMEPPPGYPRAHAGTPVGTWSDDGAQALCLLASLLTVGELDIPDLARRLVDWYERGYMAVDNRVFDVGIQTSNAFRYIQRGVSPLVSGPAGEYDNGNGSLMRVLPLALWHTGTDAQLVQDAHGQSKVTHGHSRSQVCCAVYCLWARELLSGTEDYRLAMANAIGKLDDIYGDYEDREYAHELQQMEQAIWETSGEGSGYVLDCLVSAFGCQGDTYEETIKTAVALGQDTDTTACVAGGIAGIRFGHSGIPARWRQALRGEDLVSPLVRGLVAHLTA